MDLDSRLLSSLSTPSVEAVVLYGSFARGSHTPHSDLDVLVLAEDAVSPTAAEVGGHRLDVAHYTREGIETLAARGSLFAWHLREEGRILEDRHGWLTSTLRTLPDYSSHVTDGHLLRAVLEDAWVSLHGVGNTEMFDAAVVCTVVRNLGILVTHIDGEVVFGPGAATCMLAHPHLKLDLTREQLQQLLEARRAADRGGPPPAVRGFDLGRVTSIARDWADEVIKYLMLRHGEA